MKSIILSCILACITISLTAQGDLLRRVRNKAADKLIDHVGDEIDEELDHSGENADKNGESSAEKGNTPETTADKEENETSDRSPAPEGSAPELIWSKYDFIPGDKIIFEDNQEGEENGEFPSRWDLRSGNVEIAEFGGENVIMLRDGSPEIIPYMENPGSDYLPEIFTIEFDLYYSKGHPLNIYLFDRKNQKSGSPTGYTYITVDGNKMSMGQAKSEYLENKDPNRWKHISIAYTQGKLKAYLDDTRLINIPRLDFDPKGLSLYAYHASNENRCFIKNVRIAEGGVKYYDRVLQDGKIVTNGIRFDVGKATIRPESMGIINEIFELMNEHPDLNFSIEGHTDSDGSEDANQKLSEQRAEAVMNRLVSMGISKDRFAVKGFGESVPVDTNSTPEGKANNRRVEFVKL